MKTQTLFDRLSDTEREAGEASPGDETGSATSLPIPVVIRIAIECGKYHHIEMSAREYTDYDLTTTFERVDTGGTFSHYDKLRKDQSWLGSSQGLRVHRG